MVGVDAWSGQELASGWQDEANEQLHPRTDLLSKYQKVIRGPRELLRRRTIFSAICYIVAHEAGHTARNRPGPGGWQKDNQAFQPRPPVANGAAGLRSLSPEERRVAQADPRSEVDVVRGFSREMIADSIAYRILRRPPLLAEEDDPAQALGAMSVLALQAADWWRRAALTDEDLGWSHPFPEMRMWMSKLGIASDELESAVEGSTRSMDPIPTTSDYVRDIVHRFGNSCVYVSEIDTHKATVAARGLGNRGINPVSLAFMYI